MSSFKTEIALRSFQCDRNQDLSPLSILKRAQERSIHHTEKLGYGKEKTLDKGYLWIITSQVFEIHSLPKYGDTIKRVTYPGKQIHFFFPRYFQILDRENKPLIESSALWALIDKDTRTFLDPIKAGIKIQGKEKGTEVPPLVPLTEGKDPSGSFFRKADYTALDLNGHVNNEKYLEACLSRIPTDYFKSHSIKEIKARYIKEILPGQKTKVEYSKENNTFLFFSKAFQLTLRFE